MHLNHKAEKIYKKTYISCAQMPSLMVLWSHICFFRIWFSFLFGDKYFPGFWAESGYEVKEV